MMKCLFINMTQILKTCVCGKGKIVNLYLYTNGEVYCRYTWKILVRLTENIWDGRYEVGVRLGAPVEAAVERQAAALPLGQVGGAVAASARQQVRQRVLAAGKEFFSFLLSNLTGK